MSDIHKRRFVFIDFENLKKVKFKKLEKVCHRVFILIDAREESIPFYLVQQIQRLGKAVRWIPIDKPHNDDLNLHIAFLMGKFHQKIQKQTEFAILSNDIAFDPLVSFINAHGRSCLRVRSKEVIDTPRIEEDVEIEDVDRGTQSEDSNGPLFDVAFNNGFVESTANDTVQRLTSTGNRPIEVSMLRNYILLHNQELTKQGNVDQVIKQMENNKKIAIRGGEVTYHF